MPGFGSRRVVAGAGMPDISYTPVQIQTTPEKRAEGVAGCGPAETSQDCLKGLGNELLQKSSKKHYASLIIFDKYISPFIEEKKFTSRSSGTGKSHRPRGFCQVVSRSEIFYFDEKSQAAEDLTEPNVLTNH